MIIKLSILILIQITGLGFSIIQAFGIADDYELTKRRANDVDYLKQNKNWKLQEWSIFYFERIIGYLIFFAMMLIPIFYYEWATAV